jgi:glycerol-3-phosphate dehydrogenase
MVGESLSGCCKVLTGPDGSHNDSRMNVTLALTAALYGATVVNHAEVNELVKDPETGKITGVKIKDMLQEGKDDGFYVKTKVCSRSQCVGFD